MKTHAAYPRRRTFYDADPDYTRPLYEMPPEMIKKERRYDPREWFSEQDMILITYGDIVKGPGKTPFSTLHAFVNTYNRGFISSEEVERELADPDSKLSLIQSHSAGLYRARTRRRAFHPRGPQKILHLSPEVFALVRRSPEGDEHILAVTNVTGREIRLEVPRQGQDFLLTVS